MNIIVDRFISDHDSTVSRIMIDGKFVCFGLEDEYRLNKVPAETRIPSGTYKITLRKSGSHHKKYKVRFPNMHKGMLWIRKVPNFKWILIHIGNTDEDTAGCLLVGSQAITDVGDMKVTGSTNAYVKLYPRVVDAAAEKKLTITFLDNDRQNLPTVDDPTINLTRQQKDELFNYNAEQRNKLAIQAGSLVGALLDELERNAQTFIRLKNPVQNGYKIDYKLVQGNPAVIQPLGIALGFKSVTSITLEVFNA